MKNDKINKDIKNFVDNKNIYCYLFLFFDVYFPHNNFN